MPIKTPKTASQYINCAPREAQKALREMREILKSVCPKAEEEIKWGTLAFSLDRILYMYGGFKKHIGFYPTPAVLKAFQKELKDYTQGKGSVQFPHDKPLPKTLTTKMAKYRIKDLKEYDAKWM